MHESKPMGTPLGHHTKLSITQTSNIEEGNRERRLLRMLME